jgi:hypothetical protein
MWVRGRDAQIDYKASDPADTVTFEIQDAVGAVVYTITHEAPGSDGRFVFPVSYQMVSARYVHLVGGFVPFRQMYMATWGLVHMPFLQSIRRALHCTPTYSRRRTASPASSSRCPTRTRTPSTWCVCACVMFVS